MNKKVFYAILEMDGERFKATFSGYLKDAKEACANAKQKVFEVEGVEEMISGVSKVFGSFGVKVEKLFDTTKDNLQKFFGDLGETFDPEKWEIDGAKLFLVRKMYHVAQKVGFTKEEAKELADHYYHGESVLETLKKIFPNQHSPKLQEFIMGYSRTTAEISRKSFRKALIESKDEELYDAVLMEISVDPLLWYSGVADQDLEDYFAKLYDVYTASSSVKSGEEALQDVKQALLKFL